MAESISHFVLTLTGAAQQVSTDAAIRVREFSLQPFAANTGAVFVGGSAAVTSTNYGVRIPAPVTSIPPPPFQLEGYNGGALALGDIWVIGTANEKLAVLYMRYQ